MPKYKKLEELLMECGGSYGFSHGRRLVKLAEQLSEGKCYNADVIEFCALTHDLGAFSKFAVEGMDHAVRSLEVVVPMLGDYPFSEQEKEIIIETIGAHHSAQPKKSFEADLFCNADALDFLGYIGIARDLLRAGKDMAKAVQSVRKHREQLPKLLTLAAAVEIGRTRIKETDAFLDGLTAETGE